MNLLPQVTMYYTNSSICWKMIHSERIREKLVYLYLKLTLADGSAASCGWRDWIQRYEAFFFSYRLPQQQLLPCPLVLRDGERTTTSVCKILDRFIVTNTMHVFHCEHCSVVRRAAQPAPNSALTPPVVQLKALHWTSVVMYLLLDM